MTKRLVHPRVANKDRHLPKRGYRGLPKKGGGGKGGWGVPGEEYEDQDADPYADLWLIAESHH